MHRFNVITVHNIFIACVHSLFVHGVSGVVKQYIFLCQFHYIKTMFSLNKNIQFMTLFLKLFGKLVITNKGKCRFYGFSFQKYCCIRTMQFWIASAGVDELITVACFLKTSFHTNLHYLTLTLCNKTLATTLG